MNANLPSNINRQLQALMRDEGLTLEQACSSLGLDVEMGGLALKSMRSGGLKTTLGDLIEQFRPEAVEILIDIARTGERDTDRVKACQILLEGRGIMPEVNAAAATAFKERIEAMKRAAGWTVEQPVIDVSNLEMVLAK